MPLITRAHHTLGAGFVVLQVGDLRIPNALDLAQLLLGGGKNAIEIARCVRQRPCLFSGFTSC